MKSQGLPGWFLVTVVLAGMLMTFGALNLVRTLVNFALEIAR